MALQIQVYLIWILIIVLWIISYFVTSWYSKKGEEVQKPKRGTKE
jgi:hypothetical protein